MCPPEMVVLELTDQIFNRSIKGIFTKKKDKTKNSAEEQSSSLVENLKKTKQKKNIKIPSQPRMNLRTGRQIMRVSHHFPIKRARGVYVCVCGEGRGSVAVI